MFATPKVRDTGREALIASQHLEPADLPQGKDAGSFTFGVIFNKVKDRI